MVNVTDLYKQMVEIADNLAAKDREHYKDESVRRAGRTVLTSEAFELNRRDLHLANMLAMCGVNYEGEEM